nr:protein lethal(2)essential for life transcript variant X4 [Paroster macrosturtensis]
MSMVPMMFRDWWDDMDMSFSRPSRLLDQHFGLGLRRDDLLNSISTTMPARSLLRGSGYYRPWAGGLQRQDSGSTINTDKDRFQVILDVQQFTPNEITVKTSGNSIVVEGKHEEKQDEHGFVSRHFVRRYMLPFDHDVTDVVSSLSSDGILTVTAPKKQIMQAGERVVPITQTGPAKSPQSPQPTIEHAS